MYHCVQPRCKGNPMPMPARCNQPESMWDDFPLAMAYVPMQQFKNLYESDEGLQKGTIFSELYKPFRGWKGGCSC